MPANLAIPNCLDLTGRVVVVVGATSGIGRVLALGLARHGATVVPSGRRLSNLEEVCRDLGIAACPPVDVTDRASVERLHDYVLENYGGVDVLLNVAGVTFRRPTAEVEESEWNGLLDTTLTGSLRTCQTFYPSLKASGRGRVVNVVSIGSYVGFQEVTAYCAAKTALLSLTRSLAIEWARDGICVNAIAPGIFPTALNSCLIEGTPRGGELLMRTPMKRFGCPEELVGAAVLLASDGASFITGQSIVVDGGFLASGVNQ